MKKCLLIVAALGVASALAEIDQNVQNDEPVLLPLTNLVWHCGPNTRIENGILTVVMKKRPETQPKKIEIL